LSEPVIAVLVGPEAKKLHDTQTLIASKSEYFRKGLENGWKEATEGIFTLVDENTAVFSLFTVCSIPPQYTISRMNTK